MDRRTDIFAFGTVLYEMLTGRPAFGGEDVSDILSHVLRSDPNWTLLPANVPRRIQELLRLCRQAAGDIRIDMEQALAEPGTAAPTSPARGSFLAWIAFAIVLVVAATLAFVHFREGPPPETRLDIVTPATSDPVSFELSPNGRQIVFIASGDGVSRIWVRSLATTKAQPLAGTEGAIYPFWSPDSKSVGFFADGQLKRIDIGGGAPQTLAPASAGRGGTWNADDVILFTPNAASPLFRVAATGGQAAAVTKLDGQQGHRSPVFLPDGRRFLFFAVGSPETTGIYLGSLEPGETKRLTPNDTRGVYVEGLPEMKGGWLLWVRAGTLVARQLDLDKRALTGDPLTLADTVVVSATFNMSAVSVSAAGMVAYRTGAGSRRQLAWFDRSGKPFGTLVTPVVLFRTRIFGGGLDNYQGRQYDVARDGRFLINTALDEGAAPITLMQNWNPAAKK